MKKTLLLLFVSFITYNTVFTQKKADVEAGINIGYNYSGAATGLGKSGDYSYGINIGIYGDYYFSDRWSTRAKIIYDQKGWNNGFIIADSIAINTTDFNLNYLTIPVMANWHFGKKRNWYLNFGPYAGFLLKVKETKFNDDLKRLFNPIDAGIAYGIGVKLPLSGNIKLLLEYEGQLGLVDIIKNNTGTAIHNGRGSFNIGLNYQLK